ncbi:hypothetical protein V499_00744 [Pseudogymnoascus sp. VKM F-103]|uniref:Uncharacterized protein n=1 Tax=Pseudogymnoascus verrucosus TaxID=342668 RepID=A0A1B8GN52_9PEZI|nr:uncharacterized protein VE01_04739 [Pseudogymnoascus verrucosus]KFY80445.1 hypothetical protein V499_00744 [Pseudogymnoascus sp. VKM F-103]OBT97259.1 hypothetical protein VE01_04739 [Pseudogymnoascus verrucosus]
MAFRQSTHYAPQRTYTTPEEPRLDGPSTQPDQQLEDSQEWILFSPAPASTTDRTHTATTASTRHTVGRSRLSDYGSIDTAGRSYEYDEDVSEHSEAVAEDDEEDGELDSLDSHLLEFRAESAYGDGNPVLPTHDGLGSFRLDGTMGEGVQEQLYAFERFNPRRIRRRRESLELGQRELENETSADNEQVRRIEEWRLEQSRALLDEIQKETRRRRQPASSTRAKSERDYHDEEVATLGDLSEVETSKPEEGMDTEEGESFWTRITRRVIHDLMGIDDRLLSILFGEGLSEEVEREASRRDWYAGIDREQSDDSWEYRLLGRIARELGLLVNQLSDHPGAFSTYLKVQQQPLPYAGLPIIPETGANTEDGPQTQAGSASVPLFQPTIPNTANAMDFAAPPTRSAQDEQGSAGPSKFRSQGYQESDEAHIGFSKEEWEKQLDIGLVFSYLRSRFTNGKEPTVSSHLTGSRTKTSPQDAAARAARVHQLHPLVSRPKPSERRASYKVIVPSGPIQQRRKSTSCASQSTKKSARRISGSSRHYWDINGSIGSGSLAASTGGMGAWGEV